METDYLREFTAVVENGNFADTSDEFFLSQPTLYRHMKAIEEQLGANGAVFYRTPKGVRLTPLGGVIHRYAERILALEDACRNEISQFRAAGEALIRVAAVDTNAYPQISDALARFDELYPGCQNAVNVSHGSRNLQQLEDFACDFAFVHLDESIPSEFEKELLSEDSLAALVHRDHALSGRPGALTLEEVLQYPVLVSGENSFTNRLCRRLFQEKGIRPKIALTSYNRANLKNMAEENLGIALMLKQQARTLHLQNCAVREIAPEIKAGLFLLYRKSALEKKMNRDFLSCVLAERDHPEEGAARRRRSLEEAERIQREKKSLS